MSDEQQPVYVIPEEYLKKERKTAQKENIMIAQLVGDLVRSTLGPKGMDKMLVDAMGDLVITNDGATILKETEINHPIAKIIVETAKTQEEIVGDGTTTVVILTAELLKKAEKLIEQNIHPSVISNGYKMACVKSIELLNKTASKIDLNDVSLLKKLVTTAMTGKKAGVKRDLYAELLVNAINQIADKGEVELDNIKIEKKHGGKEADTQLIRGILIDKEKVHSKMPDEIINAKIALINAALEVESTEVSAEIKIDSPDKLKAFLDQEELMIRKLVDKVITSGANALFCQKGIDDLAQHLLAKAGIFAVRRVRSSDMDKLAKATGAKVCNSIKDLSSSDLGSAGVIKTIRVGDEKMTLVEKCVNPKAVTLLIRGSSEQVIDELKRAFEDALGDLKMIFNNNLAVPGGGAVEVWLSKQLKDYALSISGREQLAVQSFAEALESVPKTLAENAGLDRIDLLTELRSSNKMLGIDVLNGRTADMWQKGVIEPLTVKTQALTSATETAVMLLRVDNIIQKRSNK